VVQSSYVPFSSPLKLKRDGHRVGSDACVSGGCVWKGYNNRLGRLGDGIVPVVEVEHALGGLQLPESVVGIHSLTKGGKHQLPVHLGYDLHEGEVCRANLNVTKKRKNEKTNGRCEKKKRTSATREPRRGCQEGPSTQGSP
jgi:hypothetical protein